MIDAGVNIVKVGMDGIDSNVMLYSFPHTSINPVFFANALDVTLNVISLFGMIIVIGILVDDGIVIGENIYAAHEKGVPRNKAALQGTRQVLPAVFAAIITTVIAFSSFLFIDGQLGDFFGEIALLANRPRTATVRVTNQAFLLKISHESFWELMGEYPSLGLFLEAVKDTRIKSELPAQAQAV